MAKAKITPKNIWAYITGKLRYKLFYSKFEWLIRKHIREQIYFRIRVMDEECYFAGSCKLCGCETTALQMANKACDKPCYPEMMNKKMWKSFTKGTPVLIGKDWWMKDEYYRPQRLTNVEHN